MAIETINVIFDSILIVFAVWMTYMTKKSIGGLIGSAIMYMNIGIVVLSLAPISYTIMGDLSAFPGVTQGFIFRFIILVGFFLLLAGFSKIRRLTMVK